MKIKLINFILIILLCSSCASNKEDIFTVSEDQTNLFENVPKSNLAEVKYGYSVYLKLLAENDIVINRVEKADVHEIGKRLARHATRRGFPYVFTILNDERIFASSTPGGFVYITSGMLYYLDNEEEIAAVLAHELAQTQKRRMDYTKKKHLANLVEDVSGYAPYVFGPAGIAVPKGVKLINNVLLKEASRVDRTMESDKLACFYLRNEGYTTEALLDVIKKVATSEAKLHSKIVDYQRLRPVTDERVKNLKEIIRGEK